MPRLLRSTTRLVLIVLIGLGVMLTPRPSYAGSVIVDPVLQRQLQSASPGATLEVIVAYERQPERADLAALLATGASIAPLRELPMVGVLATSGQIAAVRQLAGVRSIYANQQLQYFLHESVRLIGAANVWATYSYRGEGVGVAVLDTGIDATHADLLLGQKAAQNVKIVGLQYAAGQDLDSLGLPAIYVEDVPNTDTSSGHGTHVAGIAGASGGASGGYYRGVAPGAKLIGLGAGEVIEIFTALAGFDWVLAHKDDPQLNIRVVNCSWGNIVTGFDPNNPVNVATKRVHDASIAVVFAAGNSGAGTDTLNTYSVAPWVIGVAAGDKDGQTVSFFSSRGIPGDDFYHPTLTAPGNLIVSDRASTGAAVSGSSTPLDPIYVPAQYIPYYTTAAGTSMAAPHVAGTIALMVQAKPSLTPTVIKRILVNTATPMAGFQEYAAGAGYLNAKAAVDVARKIKNIRSYRDPGAPRPR